MRFIDHILDDQVIDEVVVKIVLPEGSKSAVHVWGFASLSAVHADIVPDLQEHTSAATIPSGRGASGTSFHIFGHRGPSCSCCQEN